MNDEEWQARLRALSDNDLTFVRSLIDLACTKTKMGHRGLLDAIRHDLSLEDLRRWNRSHRHYQDTYLSMPR